MYKITFSKKAIKSLGELPKDYQIKIKANIKSLSLNPFNKDLKKMHTSEATHRFRIGPYRLFLQINTTTKEIYIPIIKRRTTQTYRN